MDTILAELKHPWLDEKRQFDRIMGVKSDSIDQGDMPIEYQQMHGTFTLQRKNDMYTAFEQTISNK